MSERFLSKLFKKYRGYSKDLGGKRDLSSGFLSDRIRSTMEEALGGYKGSLLEIGCGEGLFLSDIRKSAGFNRIIGLELKQKMLAKAKKHISEYGENLFLIGGQGGELPFKDSSFDVVVCVNIFHNLPSLKEAEAIIREIKRGCRSSGMIAFDIRNGYNPIMYMAYKWVMAYDPTCKRLPLNAYFYHDIRSLLRRYRFKIIEKKGVIIPLWFLAPALVIIARSEDIP